MEQPSKNITEAARIAAEAADALNAAQDALNVKMERESPQIAHYYRNSADSTVLQQLIGWMQATVEHDDEKSAGAAETLRVVKRLADEERERHSAVSE